jgi:hypothetical protein
MEKGQDTAKERRRNGEEAELNERKGDVIQKRQDKAKEIRRN